MLGLGSVVFLFFSFVVGLSLGLVGLWVVVVVVVVAAAVRV